MNLNVRNRSDGGFTLVELLITVTIVPILVGSMGLALLAVFSQQSGVAGRLTDQGDAQVVAVNFEPDVQSATWVTTDATPTNAAPTNTVAPCASGTSLLGTQLLGLLLGNGTEISYETLPGSSGAVGNNTLFRYVCNQSSPGTLLSHSAVSYDLPSSQLAPALAGAANINAAAANGWVTVTGQNVTGVTWAITEGAVAQGAGKTYAYTVSAAPKASSYASPSAGASLTSTTGCAFANPTTGTYASTLCFIDMTNFKTIQAVNNGQCTSTGSNPDMNIAAIPGTPFFMEFCITLSPATEPTGQGNGTVPSLAATTIPTYYNPGVSGAFLGNNNFYTGIAGNPALYETTNGTTVTVNFTSILVVDGSGNAATGWSLVTGDAESTDAGESMTWTSSQPLTLLPDSPSSAYGNACAYAGQPGNVWLTGLATTTVECAASVSSIKSGTVLLQSQPPLSKAAMTLSAQLNGGGLEAVFLGILLP